MSHLFISFHYPRIVWLLPSRHILMVTARIFCATEGSTIFYSIDGSAPQIKVMQGDANIICEQSLNIGYDILLRVTYLKHTQSSQINQIKSNQFVSRLSDTDRYIWTSRSSFLCHTSWYVCTVLLYSNSYQLCASLLCYLS